MATVRILYFAKAREVAETSEESVPLQPETATTTGLLARLVALHPGLRSVLESCVLALNQEYVSQGEVVQLKDGDEVAVIPPLSGG